MYMTSHGMLHLIAKTYPIQNTPLKIEFRKRYKILNNKFKAKALFDRLTMLYHFVLLKTFPIF